MDSSLTVAGTTNIVKQVIDSIKSNFEARLLDLTVAIASEVEGNKGEEEGNVYITKALKILKRMVKMKTKKWRILDHLRMSTSGPKSPYGIETR